MPTVALSSISNYPGTINRRRELAFRVTRVNSSWWQLDVALPIRLLFIGTWSSGDRAIMRQRVMEDAPRSWSRRHLLRRSDAIGYTRCEVRVNAHERSDAAPGQQWHVIAAAPDIQGDLPESLRTHVNYDYRGRFFGATQDEHIQVEHYAFALLTQRDAGCNYDHRPSERTRSTRRESLLQFGTQHEMGHMLGMWHPCGANNEEASYGDPDDPLEGGRVMGLGSYVSRLDYHWAKQLMYLHTGDTWAVTNERDAYRSRGYCRE